MARAGTIMIGGEECTLIHDVAFAKASRRPSRALAAPCYACVHPPQAARRHPQPFLQGEREPRSGVSALCPPCSPRVQLRVKYDIPVDFLATNKHFKWSSLKPSTGKGRRRAPAPAPAPRAGRQLHAACGPTPAPSSQVETAWASPRRGSPTRRTS